MAITVRAYSEVDGQVAEASSINRVIDDLYTVVNGNIDSANIASSAVGTNELQDGAVTTSKLDSIQIYLLAEMFS